METDGFDRRFFNFNDFLVFKTFKIFWHLDGAKINKIEIFGFMPKTHHVSISQNIISTKKIMIRAGDHVLD
jgi:hypothetical protein